MLEEIRDTLTFGYRTLTFIPRMIWKMLRLFGKTLDFFGIENHEAPISSSEFRDPPPAPRRAPGTRRPFFSVNTTVTNRRGEKRTVVDYSIDDPRGPQDG